MMITDEEIEAARLAVEQAATTVSSVESRPPDGISREAGQAWAAAKIAHSRALAQLELLERTRAQQLEAAAAWAAAEATVAEDVPKLADALVASRKQLTKAVNAAQAALVAAMDAAVAHDALVRSTAANLSGRGLAITNGTMPANGGTRDGVRVAGRWWVAGPDPGTLAAWLVSRVAAVRLPRTHELIGHLRFFGGAHMLGRRGDELLADVAAVAPAKLRQLPTVERAAFEPPRVMFNSEFNRREAECRRDEAVEYYRPLPVGSRLPDPPKDAA